MVSSLRLLDANLLVSLDLLLQEQSVSAAARRQGVSQSAMSQTLRRLRELLGDEVLVRSGTRMVATPRAAALREPLRRNLAELERILADEPGFDPATSRREVHLAMSDYTATLLLPQVLARLGREAPGIDARVSIASHATLQALRDDACDLLAGVLPPGTPGIDSRPLWTETFTLLVRRGHPLARVRKNRLRAFAAARHLLVTPIAGPPRGRVDEVLAAQGKSRRVAATLPFFLAAPTIVGASDLVLTVPRKIAERFGRGLEVLEPPLDAGSFEVRLAWSARLGADPGNRWLRELVAAVAAEV
jgi:DNA-binding transcriptional LysR family regulator